MSDWQPIETAPKDGAHITYKEGPRLLCCAINPDWGDSFYPVFTARFIWNKSGKTGNWRRDIDGRRYDPTHWMPLPEPPK